jgi:hypothetical protein
MTSRDFCYWLQGFFELSGNDTINAGQVKQIKDHLNMVFLHEIDPSMGPPKHQKLLTEAHHGNLSVFDPNAPVVYRC